jgi:uncharacterized protein
MHEALQALLGGALIGLASALLWTSIGQIAGVSGIASRLLGPGALWRWAFVLGLVLGSWLLGPWLSTLHAVQASALQPAALLIAAGLLVGVGTVVGSGCTSGHGVCGLGRRSLRSLVAVLVFMSTAFATVFIATRAYF